MIVCGFPPNIHCYTKEGEDSRAGFESRSGKLQSRPGDLRDRALKLILKFPHVLDSVGLRWPEVARREA